MGVTTAGRTPGIAFEGVWKRFRRGDQHDSLRDLIPAMARRLAGRRRDEATLESGEFWALRDVSFAVGPGDALGIIGANGAGKSTALKLLTRVLGPTRGALRVTGRLGALVELSAGFHPDLTGRENVFLQGAIMGLGRREIARVFDEIVDFAGIEPFIDTQVKRYSSGMQARLGFAVAAHLDPDVLIVDEVLAVGDTAFQQKALGRVESLVRGGRPVVLVTHQLEQMIGLCTKAIVLERGELVTEGTPASCVERYLSRLLAGDMDEAHPGAVLVRMLACRPGTTVVSGDRLIVGMHCAVRAPDLLHEETLALRVRSALSGAVVFDTDVLRARADVPTTDWYWLDVSLQLNVPPGHYSVESYVRGVAAGHEVAGGPSAVIEVLPGTDFTGSVQLNPTFRVTHAHKYGPENNWRAPDAGAAPQHAELPNGAGGAP